MLLLPPTHPKRLLVQYSLMSMHLTDAVNKLGWGESLLTERNIKVHFINVK